MTRLRAVVEIGPEGVDGAAWPISTAAGYRWEVLDGSSAPDTVATVLAALAEWCRPEHAEPDDQPAAAEALGWIADSDYLVLRAGIQAADGETTVNPGCCADLEGWREWPRMWLGHDPAAWVEESAEGLLIRQERASPDAVRIATGTLPGLLAGLREDLIAFLATAERWTADTCSDPRLAAAVVANIDRHAIITAPLADA